mmetsp:Transcript_3905/g.13062  ORF Transcript_3905/g.13062 Transcript_3905/m.13062 type:complete len:200 (+) Transcript_3905:982-1581(+)
MGGDWVYRGIGGRDGYAPETNGARIGQGVRNEMSNAHGSVRDVASFETSELKIRTGKNLRESTPGVLGDVRWVAGRAPELSPAVPAAAADREGIRQRPAASRIKRGNTSRNSGRLARQGQRALLPLGRRGRERPDVGAETCDAERVGGYGAERDDWREHEHGDHTPRVRLGCRIRRSRNHGRPGRASRREGTQSAQRLG